ncbi:hypothetical protein QSJ19_18640 [Gordonia sp. ABSL11-1]|uniref:hypothetical protein n=1 Tax=Gordonia sp. ABSL11-1 TaxID=3053924 RepID=UPI00257244B1|nr:hypothetical protein [Gordonia sp. ABSL11-1]MDL9947564.1 hypothetical protein [Gordonia sp. ABSL11-1]
MCGPLAERVATDPRPTLFAEQVDDMIVAVSGAVRTIVQLLTERDAHHRTTHVPVMNRGQTVKALVSLAEVAGDPKISDADIRSGQWAAILAEDAAPFAAELADHLGKAVAPGDSRGRSPSERVEVVLREIYTAATDLVRRVRQAGSHRHQLAPKATTTSETDQARATLADLGVEV